MHSLDAGVTFDELRLHRSEDFQYAPDLNRPSFEVRDRDQ